MAFAKILKIVWPPPLKSHLGPKRFYTILKPFFSEGYLAPSGPLASLSNPVKPPMKSYWAPNENSRLQDPSDMKPCPVLSGPNRILSHPVPFFFKGLFGPIWTIGLSIKPCQTSNAKLLGLKWKFKNARTL